MIPEESCNAFIHKLRQLIIELLYFSRSALPLRPHDALPFASQ
jgi:hypothetical protein